MTLASVAGSPTPVRPLPPTRRPIAPWYPESAGPYRLPRTIAETLSRRLADYKNRDAAFALAVFLARYWSSPARIVEAFAVDRRALAGHRELELSEARIRGALAVLVEIGFVEPQEQAAGQRYQRTGEGLHRRPIMHRFSAEFGTEFAKANASAERRRAAPAPARRPLSASASVQHPHSERSRNQVAQIENYPGPVLYMGYHSRRSDNEELELAIARLMNGLSTTR